MNSSGKSSGFFWRGMSVRAEQSIGAKKTSTPGGIEAQRILLLVDAPGNRKHLTRYLENEETVVLAPDQPGEEEFDLAIVDMAGFVRWNKILREARDQAQPVFLPVMLIVSQADLARSLLVCREVVDEFLITPIDLNELNQRVAMLLRARRQALAQSDQLSFLVTHDHATGLPNKSLYMDRLTQAVQSASLLRQQLFAVVVHIPLGAILKSLGTLGLERTAMACSARLESVIPEQYSLSRLTTEEWGLMLGSGATVNDVLEICHAIHQLQNEPVQVAGERIHFTLRIGISIYPDDTATSNDLLDCAISALSHSGKSAPAFYSRSVQQQALSHIRTVTGLHDALHKEQFEVWYQPKLLISDRSPVGVEALVRWRLPCGELVPPGNFVPVAESTGLITRIDRYVLEQSCAAMQEWTANGCAPKQLAVNVSAHHLAMPDFVGTVKRVIQHYNIDPSTLELELTETALADLGTDNLAKLKALRDYGVGIALDDFGTGYCSLNYLHKLPISSLKIDKSFIDRLVPSQSDAVIVRSIVALANNFGLNLVAEGVETEAQSEQLAAMDVLIGQGFLYARPMPREAIQPWITSAPGFDPATAAEDRNKVMLR